MRSSIAGQMIRELRFNPADPQRRALWHYTDAAGLQGVLSKRELWATHYSFLNDRAEITLGEEIVHSEGERLAATKGHVGALMTNFVNGFSKAFRLSVDERGRHPFVASLCADRGDSLSQWRGYGRFGAGYAIGFKTLALPHVDDDTPADISAILMKAIYSEAKFRERARRELTETAKGIVTYCTTYPAHAEELFKTGVTTLGLRAASLALRFKHKGFWEEREWRPVGIPLRTIQADGEPVIKHRPGANGLVPYIAISLTSKKRVPLKAVRVGPTHDPDRGAGAVEGLLRGLGYANAARLVLKSEIPFRT